MASSDEQNLKNDDNDASKPSLPTAQNDQENEIDFKTMRFDDLLAIISPKLLLEYLKKISSFLNYPEEKLEFPNLPKPCEEILMRIAKDVNVLKTERLHRCCKPVSERIIRAVNLKASQNIFIVYEQVNDITKDAGNECESILVFKKLFYANAKERGYCSQGFLRSKNSITALPKSPSIDTIIISQRFTINSFLTDCLQLILEFIKDDNQLNLTLVDLSLPNAYYLHTTFSRIIANNYDSKLEGNNAVTPVWEAYILFSLKFKFSVRYVENADIFRKSLFLEKISKSEQRQIAEHLTEEDSNTEQSVDTVSTEQPIGKKKIKKMKAELNKELNPDHEKYSLHNVLQELKPEFLIESLQKMVNFLKDSAEASIIFPAKNLMEKIFLTNIVNISQSVKLKKNLIGEVRLYFDVILDLVYNKVGYKLSMRRGSNANREKQVRYTKKPVFNRPARMSRPWYILLKKPLGSMTAPLNREEQSVSGFYQAKQVSRAYRRAQAYSSSMENSKDLKSGHHRNQDTGILDSEKDAVLMAAIEKHDMTMFPELAQPWAKKADQIVVKQTQPLEKKAEQNVVKLAQLWGNKVEQKVVKLGKTYMGKAKRNEQLLEALSVPVQSEKAIRMMRSMGWEGGALGSKGNGITEPIMPRLGLNSGAGLGCHTNLTPLTPIPPLFPTLPTITPNFPTASLVPTASSSNPTLPPKTDPIIPPTLKSAKRNSPAFRIAFLQEVLNFLKSEYDKKILNYSPKMRKKDKNFLLNIMNLMAVRDKMSCIAEYRHVVISIVDEYMKFPDLVVTAVVCETSRQVTLSKIHNWILVRKDKFRIPKPIDGLTNNPEMILQSFGPVLETRKTLQRVRFRIEVLLALLNFIKNDQANEMTVFFVDTFQQRRFIHLSIEKINKKVKFGSTAPEQILSIEIAKYMGAYDLSAQYMLNFFVATKVYPHSHNIIGNNNNNKINNDKTQQRKAENDNTNCYMFIRNVSYNSSVTEMSKSNISIDSAEIISISDDSDDNDKNDKRDIPEAIEITSDDKIEMIKDDCDDISDHTSKMIDDVSDHTSKMIDDISDHTSKMIEDISDNTSHMIVDNSDHTSQMVDDLSDNSAYTANLDYSEGDGPEDMSMSFDGDKIDDNNIETVKDLAAGSKLGLKKSDEEIKSDSDDLKISDDVIECDKLELSFNSNLKTLLSTDLVDKQPINDREVDVYIVYLNKNHFLTENMPKYIQGLISLNIVQSKELPLLKCHGVQNDALVYSCHTKKSYDWLQEICVANNINIVTKEFNKMLLKINTFFTFDDDYFIDMIQLYNKNVSTKEWRILKKEVFQDSVVFTIEMDKKSFKYILDSNLELYAGVDKVTFSIIFD